MLRQKLKENISKNGRRAFNPMARSSIDPKISQKKGNRIRLKTSQTANQRFDSGKGITQSQKIRPKSRMPSSYSSYKNYIPHLVKEGQQARLQASTQIRKDDLWWKYQNFSSNNNGGEDENYLCHPQSRKRSSNLFSSKSSYRIGPKHSKDRIESSGY